MLRQVEKIIMKREVRGKLMYLVKWKGYGEDENTWEPREHLQDNELLREEMEQCPLQPKPQPRKKRKRLTDSEEVSCVNRSNNVAYCSSYKLLKQW